MGAPHVQLVPDTPDHHQAHHAGQRALARGWRPILTCDDQGFIVVLVAFRPAELDELLDHLEHGSAPDTVQPEQHPGPQPDQPHETGGTGNGRTLPGA